MDEYNESLSRRLILGAILFIFAVIVGVLILIAIGLQQPAYGQTITDMTEGNFYYLYQTRGGYYVWKERDATRHPYSEVQDRRDRDKQARCWSRRDPTPLWIGGFQRDALDRGIRPMRTQDETFYDHRRWRGNSRWSEVYRQHRRNWRYDTPLRSSVNQKFPLDRDLEWRYSEDEAPRDRS